MRSLACLYVFGGAQGWFGRPFDGAQETKVLLMDA